MYTLDSASRQLLASWFEEPFSVSALEERDQLGGRFSVIRKESGRWLLHSSRRAMVWVRVAGDQAVAYQLFEGEEARRLDREFGLSASKGVRKLIADLVVMGGDPWEAFDALDAEVDDLELVAEGPPQVWLVGEEGVVEVDVSNDRITGVKIYTGSAAFDRLPEPQPAVAVPTTGYAQDPGDLVLLARRLERQGDLLGAAEAVKKALTFIPEGAEKVPEDVFITAATLWMYRKDPAISREQLLAWAESLREHQNRPPL
ncbi:MAG: hypothetical protein KF760_25990 [Candidatus Eremiobacteraeota bacterium]|nr:hypothetical protein [Candidatus Eremiobacteraeota bacterium]